MFERIPHNHNDVLILHGRQQIEIALAALAFANVEANVTRILQATVEAYRVSSGERRTNNLSSTVRLALGGREGYTMKSQVLMSLDVVIVSDETNNIDRIAAQELREILTMDED